MKEELKQEVFANFQKALFVYGKREDNKDLEIVKIGEFYYIQRKVK